ncbi:unnamed protein product [Boreogadus saida]
MTKQGESLSARDPNGLGQSRTLGLWRGKRGRERIGLAFVAFHIQIKNRLVFLMRIERDSPLNDQGSRHQRHASNGKSVATRTEE